MVFVATQSFIYIIILMSDVRLNVWDEVGATMNFTNQELTAIGDSDRTSWLRMCIKAKLHGISTKQSFVS